MRFGKDDDADSSQMEDRRGGSRGGLAIGGGGLGIAGVVVYVLIRLLGGNVTVDDSGGGGPAPSAAPSVPDNQELGGSCEGVSSTTNPPKFISCVVSNVQRFWARTLPRQGGQYEPAHMVLFAQA